MSWFSLLDLLPGWMLGLLTSLLTIAVADRWRTTRRRKMLKTAIRIELDFTLENLAWIVWKLSVRFDDFDDHTVGWLRPLIMKYGVERARRTPVSAFPEVPGVWDTIEQDLDSLVNNPNKRRQLLSDMRVGYTRSDVSLRKQNLAVFAGDAEAVRCTDAALQKRLHGVMRHMAYYNEIVDESRFYFRATLSSDLSEVNRSIVESNLDGAYKAALGQAKILLSRMDELVRDDSLW